MNICIGHIYILFKHFEKLGDNDMVSDKMLKNLLVLLLLLGSSLFWSHLGQFLLVTF